ncbi:MAG: hypothetical protein PHC64_08625, partial [Candidatus Gastranaerophilales bacterium]|nr:hypothetical protein [Candidatus Gastranaerophilales bacterium]
MQVKPIMFSTFQSNNKYENNINNKKNVNFKAVDLGSVTEGVVQEVIQNRYRIIVYPGPKVEAMEGCPSPQ